MKKIYKTLVESTYPYYEHHQILVSDIDETRAKNVAVNFIEKRFGHVNHNWSVKEIQCLGEDTGNPSAINCWEEE